MALKIKRDGGTSLGTLATFQTHASHSVTFACGGDKPPLILDADGFTYRGERILDAGEAYRLFMDCLKGWGRL